MKPDRGFCTCPEPLTDSDLDLDGDDDMCWHCKRPIEEQPFP